jgi:TDG/mug DNA glycosylase family protein
MRVQLKAILMPGPSKKDIASARDKTVPDVLAKDLNVLFSGINPGLYSAAVGYHFGRPGNRFWKVIHLAGFTPSQLQPSHQAELLRFCLGITNLVPRATATADQLAPAELRQGAAELERKVEAFKPKFVAFLGLGAYRSAFGRKDAQVGLQTHPIGDSKVWLLPNPSGLNAYYQINDLVGLYRNLMEAASHLDCRQ